MGRGIMPRKKPKYNQQSKRRRKMKKLIVAMLALAVTCAAAPVFAGTGVIDHNTVAAELKVSKKVTKSETASSKIAVTAGKDIFVNAFGNEFDAVEDDKGWYGILGYEIQFE